MSTNPTNPEEDVYNVFTPESCSNKEKKERELATTVTFRKNGAVGISNGLFNLLQKNGSGDLKIRFLQDKENPKDWYLHADPKEGWVTIEKGKIYKYREFFSQTLSEVIREVLGFGKVTIVIMVSRHPIDNPNSPYHTYFPILTKSAKESNKVYAKKKPL